MTEIKRDKNHYRINSGAIMGNIVCFRETGVF